MTPAVKVGLIGAGLIGREHAKYCQTAKGLELFGIADVSAEAAATARQYDVPLFHDYRELLGHPDIDAVIIALPNAMHDEVAVAAMERGLPVLVEKPLADTLEAARHIVDMSEHFGVPVLVGHQRRYAPDVAAAKEFIREGGLGQIVSVAIHSTWRKDDDYFNVGWRTTKGAGPVLINLIHDIDVIRYLVGEIESTVSLGSTAARGFEVADTVGAVMKFAHGAIGTALTSDAAASPWCWDLTSGYGAYFPRPPAGDVYYISGTEASLALPSLTVSRHKGASNWQVPIEQSTLSRIEVNPYVAQLEHFCAVTLNEAAPLISAADAIKSLKVALEIEAGTSAQTTGKDLP